MARSVKSLLKLLAEINALAPNRNKASDGWIGDPAHASRHSDHNPEPDGTVDARDFTHDPARGADMNKIAARIVANKDRRVSYLIWNRRICSGNRGPSPWVWRPYGGSNPHDKHLHVSVLDANQDDESPWLNQEDEMTPAQEKKLDQLLEWVGGKKGDYDTGLSVLQCLIESKDGAYQDGVKLLRREIAELRSIVEAKG